MVAWAVAISSTAIYRTTVGSGGGPPPGKANIWVDQNGGTCVDNASPVDYTDAQACTLDAANDTCEAGDTVLVKGGASYGNVTISNYNSRSGYCSIGMDGAVTLQDLETGHISTCTPGTASSVNWLKITGPFAARSVRMDCSEHMYVDDLAMDATGMGNNAQVFHIERSAFFTLVNSDLHDCLNCEALFWDAGDSPNLLFDHNNVYDDKNNTGGAIHTECLRFSTENNVTLSRSHFWSCDVYDVFLAGTELRTDYLVENNVFEDVLGPNHLGFAFRGDAGTGPTPSPDGMVFRYNVFGRAAEIQMDGTENAPTANGFEVYGNASVGGFLPCGLSNTTYSYNVTQTGTSNCGGTGAAQFSLSSLLAGFVDPRTVTTTPEDHTEPAGNYQLVAGSPLCNIGDTANYPSLDFDGVSRFSGSAPEVGPYEFSGC